MLAASGRHVRYLVRPGSNSPGLVGIEADRIEAELSRSDALVRAMDGASVLYHLAGKISLSAYDRDQLHLVNVDRTASVLDAAVRARVGRFVHVGSVEAFPLAGGPYPITEEHPLDPERTITEYGRSKARGIRLVMDAHGSGIEVIVCCPTALIGPPDYRVSPVGRFVLDYMRRRLPACVDGGFDFVDIRDAADGLMRAAEIGRGGRLYLLSGHYVEVPELIRMLEEQSGVRRPPICFPIRCVAPFVPLAERLARLAGRSPRFTSANLRLLSLGVRVDSTRARDELGYTVRPFRETVADTVAWFTPLLDAHERSHLQ